MSVCSMFHGQLSELSSFLYFNFQVIIFVHLDVHYKSSMQPQKIFFDKKKELKVSLKE